MPIPQSPFGQDRQGSRHYADTKRCCAREATPKRSSDRRGESPPLQGRPVRRQDVDAGAKLAPQRKSEDLYYRSVFAVSVCAALHHFPLQYTKYSCGKMACPTRKFLAVGHIFSFQIHSGELCFGQRFRRDKVRRFGPELAAFLRPCNLRSDAPVRIRRKHPR